MSEQWSGLVPLKRKPMMSDHVSLTIAQAFALSLVFEVADWAVTGSRTTRVDFTGRHRIATGVARVLVDLKLLVTREYLPYLGARMFETQTHYKITGRGIKAVRGLLRRGHDLDWLKANQRLTKAVRWARLATLRADEVSP